MLITDILARNKRMYGSEIALVEREPAKNRRVEISWDTFDQQANRLANSLKKGGVSKGDRVVQLMSNCLEWLPRYKRPRVYIFGDVPRNPTGKIEKPKLRQQYSSKGEVLD